MSRLFLKRRAAPAADPPYKSYLAVALSYCATVGALYLFGFWGAFEINVLEFVTLSDLLKLAIYPMLVLACVATVGAFHGELSAKAFPIGGGANTPIGRFGRSNWEVILYLLSTIVLLIPLLMESPRKWLIVAFLLPILSIPLTHAAALIKWIPHPRIRFFVVYAGVLLAATAFATGRLDADRAKQGLAPLVVDVKRSGIALTEAPNKPVVYLGRLGEFFAVYETGTGQIVLLPNSKLNLLPLVNNPKRP